MRLKKLEIRGVRNIKSLDLDCSPFHNLIHGKNGSGKTSILEAIHLLALGRSFRSHLKSRLINDDSDALSVFSQIQASDGMLIPAGIQKFISGETLLRLNGENTDSISHFAKAFPVQLLNPDSYELLNMGSKPKRQFIDWGAFHVEHSFYSVWTKADRVLKQRNSALKQQARNEEITVWDLELVNLAAELHSMRQKYLEELLPCINAFIEKLAPFPEVNIEYIPGWDTSSPLEEQLKQNIERDRFLGYTRLGPQRASLSIESSGKPVQDVLSRGQQKTLLFILKFAQAELLSKQKQKNCIFLIDDLSSELDAERRKQIISLIQSFKGQFFITGVDLTGLEALQKLGETKTFHVEQ
jgi:DNA replication and repair protein RecF